MKIRVLLRLSLTLLRRMSDMGTLRAVDPVSMVDSKTLQRNLTDIVSAACALTALGNIMEGQTLKEPEITGIGCAMSIVADFLFAISSDIDNNVLPPDT
jgi:hypothetical protein